MKREGHDNVTFFIGPEVEQTPAFSKKTLFVVGKQDISTIESIARTHRIQHIFMGANHSFEYDPEDKSTYWKDTITKLLDKGFWVTLDYPAHEHEQVLTMFSAGVWQSRMFIPMLRVCIPKIETSSPNLVVKIDDVDFKATNRGVWCAHFHELTDSNRFTDWQDYGTDVVIKKTVEVQPSDAPAKPVETVLVNAVPKKKLEISDFVKPSTAPVVVKPAPKAAAVIDTNPMGLDVDAASALNNVPEVPAPKKESVRNSQTAGLDPTSPSKLKPEPKVDNSGNGVVVDTAPPAPVPAPKPAPAPVVKTTKDIVDAYTAGTKEDPLSKKVVVKTKVGKKQ
jgi:hypothetical protein